LSAIDSDSEEWYVLYNPNEIDNANAKYPADERERIIVEHAANIADLSYNEAERETAAKVFYYVFFCLLVFCYVKQPHSLQLSCS
jgi:hypothetical protein